MKKAETPSPVLATLAWSIICKVLKSGERPERDWTEASVAESIHHIMNHCRELEGDTSNDVHLEHILVRAAMAIWKRDADKETYHGEKQ
jgi:hypothetical protein